MGLQLQDLAYADIVFDGYTAPSIAGPGAMDVAVEFYTLSKLQHAWLENWVLCGK